MAAGQNDRREIRLGAMLWPRHRDQDHAPALQVVQRCPKPGMRQPAGGRQVAAGLVRRHGQGGVHVPGPDQSRQAAGETPGYRTQLTAGEQVVVPTRPVLVEQPRRRPRSRTQPASMSAKKVASIPAGNVSLAHS